MINKFKYALNLVMVLNILSGCSNSQYLSSSYQSSFDLIYNLFRESDNEIDSDFIENLPYASSLISFGDNKKSLIILKEKSNNLNTWISADNVMFDELQGRIITTIGLPNDLYSIKRPPIEFNEIIQKKKVSYISYYSFKKPDFRNLKVNIESYLLGKKEITILKKKINVFLIEEHIYAPDINWRAVNRYWIDEESSFVWKSTQSLTPNLPEIKIEVTKKPA